jgi:hypothetical protein
VPVITVIIQDRVLKPDIGLAVSGNVNDQLGYLR